MQYLHRSVYLTTTATGTPTSHIIWWLWQPAGGHSISNACRVAHHVWNQVLLKDSREEVGPGAKSKDAHVVPTMGLGLQGGTAGVRVVLG